MQMNEAQTTCIHTVEGPMIVIACPGSGKTTTLLARIRHMVKDVGISPSRILMMTFTRAAAQEMRKRYESEPGSEKGVTFCTIHALCLSILTRYFGKPELFSEEEERDFFFQVLQDARAKYPTMQIRKEFKERLASIMDRESFVSDLLLDISVCKNNPGREQPLKSTSDRYLFRYLFDFYEAYKEEQGKIDFDDMLTKTYDALLNDPQILNALKTQFQYIQVDEYQDTNYIQRDIIYLLAGENGNLAVVGDDDQSIYGFRGAKPEIMLDFPKDYPAAKVIRMDTNYRSAKTIVKCAGRMIGRNEKRYEKKFLASKEDDGLVELTIGKNREHQIMILGERVVNLLGQGVKDDQIAILYRTNREAEMVGDALLRLGVEFQVADGITNKYEHWIRNDIFAYYRLANDLGTRQDLYRILNHPQRYLNEHAYLDWPDRTPDGHFRNSDKNREYMENVLAGGSVEFWKVKKAKAEIDRFFRLLRSLKGKEPGTFMKTLSLVYKAYIASYAEFRGIGKDELEFVWDSYLQDIEKLSEDAPCTWKDWETFIRKYEYGIRQARKSKRGVLLSSMHKSKGLEWDHVIIINCVDKNIPYEKEGQTCDMEEERRLFYVACTRAKLHLELMGYQQNGVKKAQLSPFIKELNQG